MSPYTHVFSFVPPLARLSEILFLESSIISISLRPGPR